MKNEQQTNPQLKALILEAVENQLRDLDPPETMETYQKLLASGHSDAEARRLIGCALTSEIVDVVNSKKEYNPKRYIGYLRRLPTLPWE